MSLKSDAELGVNSWLEDELYQQYLHDGSGIDESWKRLFQEPRAAPASTPAMQPAFDGDASRTGDLQPLRGAAGRIAQNMAASVVIPLATSQRTIAVKVM